MVPMGFFLSSPYVLGEMNVQKKKINLQMNCWVFLLLWMEKDQWKTKNKKTNFQIEIAVKHMYWG